MESQYLMELLGTLFFAMSGAIAAAEKDPEHDWFGAAFIGFVTAIGGGSMRDILLDSYPLVWISDTNFLHMIWLGILLTGLFYKLLVRLRRTLQLFDTLGISLFTIVGTEKAMGLGVNPEIAAIMGMFSAVMGGVIRDTLTNEVPVIFKKEIYASACLIGACLYLFLASLHVDRNLNFVSSVLLIIVVRLLAVRFDLRLPRFSSEPDSD